MQSPYERRMEAQKPSVASLSGERRHVRDAGNAGDSLFRSIGGNPITQNQKFFYQVPLTRSLFSVITEPKNEAKNDFGCSIPKVTSGFHEVNSGIKKARKIKAWAPEIVLKRWRFR